MEHLLGSPGAVPEFRMNPDGSPIIEETPVADEKWIQQLKLRFPAKGEEELTEILEGVVAGKEVDTVWLVHEQITPAQAAPFSGPKTPPKC